MSRIVPEFGVSEALVAELHRTHRLADGRPVLIKLLDAAAHPERVPRLERELERLSRLRPPGVPAPLGLQRHGNMLALVLEDPGGEPLSRLLTHRPMALEAFLPLAVALARSLGALHRQGLTLRSVHPGGILWDPETSSATFLEFGYADDQASPSTGSELPVAPEMLGYMSPEQTGRMNRLVDYRTDLYSLGVTLYELLVGTRPFEASTSLEWFHCHIARAPRPPMELASGIPKPVSDLVMKLLAKAAEDRYQTACGLESDLVRLLDFWKRDRTIPSVRLGEDDRPERLLIPQRLYGRDEMREELLSALDAVVSSGAPVLVAVSGDAGAGKTALVGELARLAAGKDLFFAMGKSDQYRPDAPHQPLFEAFRELMARLLTQSEEQLALWRERFEEALGINAQLIADAVPLAELVLGARPAPPELLPAEARHRFNLVLRSFVATLASRNRPLILFLDNLNWSDSGTLDLVEQLVTHRETGAVLVVVAYRSTGLPADDPVSSKLESMRRSGASLHNITLGTLSFEDVAQLVADALHDERREIEPLARLVFEKTRGNPFFVIRFLFALRDEGLLQLDGSTRRWTWDLERIRAKGYTDNVIELLVQKLGTLSAATLEALKNASCMGDRFELSTLAALTALSPSALRHAVEEAQREGLLLRRGERDYGFVHDRIQQAAYSLLGEPQRQATHLQVGRAMLSVDPEPTSREKLFEIAAQLDAGLALVTDPEEKRRFAALNLKAASRALSSSAFQAARDFALAAWSLLQPQDWVADYALQSQLHDLLAQAEYLNGNLSRCKELVSEAIDHLHSDLERAEAVNLLIIGQTLEGAYQQAVETGREGLARLGIRLPRDHHRQALRKAVAEIDALIGERDPLDLLGLPLLEDPVHRAAQRLLLNVDVPAYIADPELYPVVIARMVRHSLLHGHSLESCKSYVNYGLVLGAMFGRHERGYRFAQLGWLLTQRLGAIAVQCKTGLAVGAFIQPWVRPIPESTGYFEEGLRAGLATGDLQFIPYLLFSKAHLAYVAAASLPQVRGMLEEALGWATTTQNQWALDSIRALCFAIDWLRDTTDPRQITSAERSFVADLTRRDNRSSLCVYHCYRAQRLLLAGESGDALEHARLARQSTRNILGSLTRADAHLYHSLAKIEQLTAEGGPVPPGALADRELRRDRTLLKLWARSCPANFLHKSVLLEAELARARGRDLAAMRLFEKAIQTARARGFVQDEGLAATLAAGFYRQRGFNRIADACLGEAHACYRRWGANALVAWLERAHPWLALPSTPTEPRSVEPFSGLDTLPLVRALQAISGEMVLPRLVEVVMRTVLESAGAERGVLLLARDEELSIGSEARVVGQEIEVTHATGVGLAEVLPVSLVRFVKRARQGVLLDDVREHPTFSTDPYFTGARAVSVFCLPLLRQARLVGLLYLENHLVRGAFTAQRREELELLAAQAAVSLDNAGVYEALRDREEQMLTVLNTSPVAIAVLDREQNIQMLNDRFVQLFGWTREQLPTIEQWWPRAYPDEKYRTEVRDEWYRRLQNPTGRPGEIAPYEVRVRCRNGEERYIEFRAATVAGRTFVVLSDLSERKRADEERERLVVAAQAANEEKDQFLAVLSHELRNPLAAVQAGVELLRRTRAAEEPRVKSAIEVIERNARLQTRLVNDLLELSRVVRGQIALQRVPVRLDSIASVALQASQAEAARSGISLQLRAAPELWVYADVDRLQQVLMNLVSNAVKFTPAGGRTTVSIEQAEAGWGRVVVEDTGYGIEAGRLPTLFKMFQPGAVGGRRASGLGIGLALVKTLTEMHGGRVWAESTGPGHGSRFTLELPLGEAPPPVPVQPVPQAPSKGPVRVLLVEDNEDARLMLTETLAMLGYQVLAAESGEAGLELLAREPHVAVILADIGLPGIDGYEFLRRARKVPSAAQTPAFAVTGYGSEQNIRRSREVGFGGHFVKPVDLAALDRRIQQALQCSAP